MKSDSIEAQSPLFFILKCFSTFGLIFLCSVFYLSISINLYELSGLKIDSLALTVWYLSYFYLSYLFGFCILKMIHLRNTNIDFAIVKVLVYVLVSIYYLVLLLRYYSFDIKHDMYGFRVILGYIYPFWMFTPLLFSNFKVKYHLYFLIILCVAEILLWFLFFHTNSSNFYEEPFVYVCVLISSLIFIVTFPWYVSWLNTINIHKWLSPFFLKEENIISKLISWVVIVIGVLFMFLFFFTF